MSNEKPKILISTKDIVYVITLMGLIVAFFVRFALIEAKVEDHDKQLKEHNLDVIVRDVREIKEDIKEIDISVEEIKDIVRAL